MLPSLITLRRAEVSVQQPTGRHRRHCPSTRLRFFGGLTLAIENVVSLKSSGEMHMDSPNKPRTLSDADILSHRSVNRRSLLGTLGVGVTVAVAAVLGGTVPSEAGKRRRRRTTFFDRDPWDWVRDTCDTDSGRGYDFCDHD